MITTGLTDKDLELIEMNLDELKNRRNEVLKEMLELQVVLDAITDDPVFILPKTVNVTDSYIKKWMPNDKEV